MNACFVFSIGSGTFIPGFQLKRFTNNGRAIGFADTDLFPTKGSFRFTALLKVHGPDGIDRSWRSPPVSVSVYHEREVFMNCHVILTQG